jgi:hypothetical protein
MLPSSPRSKIVKRSLHGGRTNCRQLFCRPWLEVLEPRTTPDITLSISNPAPFPKPDTGQLMGMFVVTRSGDLAPTVQVDYATQDGTGTNGAHAGIDYVTTSGTLNFGANQTMATISVPIIGNNIFQADKTFTVSLSNPRPNELGFAPQQTFLTSASPFSIAVADFNGDGKPDVAALSNDGLVSVLLNTTPVGGNYASFADGRTFAAGDSPVSVAVGDFNGDGKPDLAIANGSTVSVLVNTTPAGGTTPTFAPLQSFNGGGISVAVADFNGDGKPDLAVASLNSVSILLNTTPTGATTVTFAAGVSFPTGHGEFNSRSVAVGDFNGDGKPDLAVANSQDNTVSVLLNRTPTGATAPDFAPQQTFGTESNPFQVAVADFNGDGKPDLAVANANSLSVSVLLNTTPTGATIPTFAPQRSFGQTDGHPWSIAAVDFNGDGKPDIVTANMNRPGTVSVFVNNTPTGASTASFASQVPFEVGLEPRFVAVGDFNGDGKPDLVAANTGSGVPGTVSVLLNTSTGPITISGSPATGTISSANQSPVEIAAVAGTTPQSAAVNTPFVVPLAVDTRNAAGHLVQNVSVTFTAPGSGPGGSFSGMSSVTILTNSLGRATAPTFTANTLTGGYQVTAQAAGGSNPSTSFNLTNTAGAPATLMATAGGNQSATVNSVFPTNLLATLIDQYGNRVPDVTITFAAPVTGASAAFAGGNTATTDTNGQVSKAITANTVAGSYNITAVASGGSNPMATFVNLTNTPAAASIFILTGLPATLVAGTPSDLTITARDPFNNIATGYNGTVHFLSTDGNAALPVDYSFTASDQGVHTFPGITLFTAGTQFVIAYDPLDPRIDGISPGVIVFAAAADHFAISAPESVPSGSPFDVTVTALDPYGNIDMNYLGTVTWTTTDPDPGVMVPPDYPFQPGDAGRVTFSGGVTLITPGDQTITIADTVDEVISGNAILTVIPSTATRTMLKALANPVPIAPLIPYFQGTTMPAIDRKPEEFNLLSVGETEAPVIRLQSRFLGQADTSPIDDVFASLDGVRAWVGS